MSDQDQDDDDKQYDASERKLAQAREQGDMPRSEDLQTSAAFAGLVVGFFLAGSWAILSGGKAGMLLFSQLDLYSNWTTRHASPEILGLALSMAGPTLVLMAGPFVGVLVYLTATHSWSFVPSKLAFKKSRISVIDNAKQKFGRSGLVEFLKRFAKLLAISVLLALFLRSQFDEILLSVQLDAGPISALIGEQVLSFLKLFLLIATVFGAVDFLWQRMEFARRNRMTRQEMVDEFKESEGDPHIKADRRRRAQEIATNRMLADVPKADVVIVNPTHYAVALTWTRGNGSAPRCVAKGTDEIAARIREKAQEHGVPIRRDPPTARAIFAVIEIGQEIRVEHYAAVAAAIRFADAMRKKARR